jgi:tRNA modification GTPase
LKEDTIIAIATPPGIGAISIIRVSGPDSFRAVDEIFKGKVKISNSESHHVHYGKIHDFSGDLIDDVLISVFRAPRSYTCEDSVEISIHGNPNIATRILNLLVKLGVRLAEPGEFSKRAFINGRFDLSQAEAVADLIKSSSDVSLRGARNQLNGLLSRKINTFRDTLLKLSSFLELELDFSEEDIGLIDRTAVSEETKKLIKEIDELLDSYSYGKVIRDGVNVAIVGEPNVGKSSILNYILKESRSIVSKVPGTTRDIIREEISIDGMLFKLFDTAGIRHSDDEIEKEGINRSMESVKNADIVLLIGDVQKGFSEDLIVDIKETNTTQKVIKVLNKSDLAYDKRINFDLLVSAKTGSGMSDLIKKIKAMSLETSIFSEKSAVVTNLRHYNCLSRAKVFLVNVLESLEKNLSGEFISVDLRNAEQSLAEIVGAITSEDILNNIFSKFCIGK